MTVAVADEDTVPPLGRTRRRDSPSIQSMSEYVTCPIHGIIKRTHKCGDTAGDHECAYHAEHHADDDFEPDQVSSHDAWSSELSSRMKALVDMHSNGQSGSGTTGFCAVCDSTWPCWTWHVALGFDNYSECEAAGWCEHAREKI